MNFTHRLRLQKANRGAAPFRLRGSARLRRRHEALIHPFGQIGAEPFRRQFSTKPSFLTLLINQSPCSSELNAYTRVALVVDNLLVAGSAGMLPRQDLP